MSDQKKPDLMDLTALVTSDYPDLADESEDKPENDMLAHMDHDAIRQFLKGQGYDVHKHRSAKAAISQANDVAGKKDSPLMSPPSCAKTCNTPSLPRERVSRPLSRNHWKTG